MTFDSFINQLTDFFFSVFVVIQLLFLMESALYGWFIDKKAYSVYEWLIQANKMQG